MKHILATAFLTCAMPLLAFAQAANVSRTDISVSGYNVTASPSSAPSGTAVYYANDGRTLLVFRNTSGNAASAVVTTQAASVDVQGFGPVTLSNQSITIPSNTTIIAGPFAMGRWNNSQYGTIQVSVTIPNAVSTTALRVPPQ